MVVVKRDAEQLKSEVERLQEQCAEEMYRKNHDYGRDNITEEGILGLAVRLKDKVQRVKNLVTHYNMVTAVADEDIRKTFLDISNYGIIGMMLAEGTWQYPIFYDEDPDDAAARLRHPMVYLGGPIDGVSHTERWGWREIAANRLVHYGASCFNPLRAFTLPEGLAGARADMVRVINRAAIFSSDIVLINLSGHGRGLGSIREIEFAASLGKKVVVVLPEAHKSLEAHDLICFENLDDALGHVVDTIMGVNS